MPLTAQQIADDVNIELRHYFADPGASVSGDGLALMVSWINRVHQDVLHTSPIWSTYTITSETFESAVGGSPYILAANNIRRVIEVYDVANRRNLIPYHDINFQTGTGIPQEKAGPPRAKRDQQDQSNAQYPQYYTVENCIVQADGSVTQGIHLISDPDTTDFTGTIRYFYYKAVDEVDDAADNLVIPEDGRDVMVAGVAMHASMFAKRPADAAVWRDLYTTMKRGY